MPKQSQKSPILNAEAAQGATATKISAAESRHELLQTALAELCFRRGVSLIALEIRGTKERRIVEVYVDKPDGITLDECGEISGELGDLLEEMKAFPAAYRLDVSSPGVERPLQFLWQYTRNIGRILALELQDGIRLKGRIAAVDGDSIVLESPAKSNKASSNPKNTSAIKSDNTNAFTPTFPFTVLHSHIKQAVVELAL